MPAFIKTPADEEKWSRAKKAAGKNKWALTNFIFQKMKHKKKRLHEDLESIIDSFLTIILKHKDK